MLPPRLPLTTGYAPSPRYVWSALIGVLLITAAVWLWYTQPQVITFGGIIVLAAGAILWVSADPEAELNAELDDRFFNEVFFRPHRLIEPPKPRHILLIPGIALSVIAAVVAGYTQQIGLQSVSNLAQSPLAQQSITPFALMWSVILLWLTGIGLTCAGIAPRWEIAEWLVTVRETWVNHRREIVFVLGLTLIAFLLRVIALGNTPSVMGPQEGLFSLESALMRSTWQGTPFQFDSAGQPLLYHFLQIFSISIFGQTLEAARFPSVIVGALTIPGVYLAGRRLFDKRIAAAAALFITTSSVHMQFSRLALNPALDPFFTAWMLAFLTAALRKGDRVEYALAGVTLGLAQYGTTSGRMLIFIAIIYCLLYYGYRREMLHGRSRFIFFPFIIAVICLIPQIYIALQTHNFPTSQWILENTGTYTDLISNAYRWPIFIVEQVSRSFLGWVVIPDNGVLYGSFDPYLGWLGAIPFLVGLIMAFVRWRNPHWSILAVSVVGTSLSSALHIDPPQYDQMLLIIPIASILVALGTLYIADLVILISKRLTPLAEIPYLVERWLMPFMLIMPLVFMGWNDYFINYQDAGAYFVDTPAQTVSETALSVLTRLKDYKIWYLPSTTVALDVSPVIKYLVPDANAQVYVGSIEELPELLASQQEKQALIIAPDYPDLPQIFKRMTRRAGWYFWPPLRDIQSAKFPSVFVFATTPP